MTIIPLIEFEGGPDPLWYYTKGHVSKGDFLSQFRKMVNDGSFGATVHWDCQPSIQWADKIGVRQVTHEWWHFFPSGIQDPPGAYAQVDGPGQGNFAVTVLSVDYRMGNAEHVGLL